MINIISDGSEVFNFSINEWVHSDNQNITKLVTNLKKDFYRKLRQHSSEIIIDCQHPQNYTKSGNFFLKISCTMYNLSSSLNESILKDYFLSCINNADFLTFKK